MSPDFAARHPRLAELFGLDLRSLALFRALLGGILFWLSLGRGKRKKHESKK